MRDGLRRLVSFRGRYPYRNDRSPSLQSTRAPAGRVILRGSVLIMSWPTPRNCGGIRSPHELKQLEPRRSGLDPGSECDRSRQSVGTGIEHWRIGHQLPP